MRESGCKDMLDKLGLKGSKVVLSDLECPWVVISGHDWSLVALSGPDLRWT